MSLTYVAGISWNGLPLRHVPIGTWSRGVALGSLSMTGVVGFEAEFAVCKAWTAAIAASLAISLEALAIDSWIRRRMLDNCPSVKLLSFASWSWRAGVALESWPPRTGWFWVLSSLRAGGTEPESRSRFNREFLFPMKGIFLSRQRLRSSATVRAFSTAGSMAAWFCARARRVGGIVFVEQASCDRRSAATQLHADLK